MVLNVVFHATDRRGVLGETTFVVLEVSAAVNRTSLLKFFFKQLRTRLIVLLVLPPILLPPTWDAAGLRNPLAPLPSTDVPGSISNNCLTILDLLEQAIFNFRKSGGKTRANER